MRRQAAGVGIAGVAGHPVHGLHQGRAVGREARHGRQQRGVARSVHLRRGDVHGQSPRQVAAAAELPGDVFFWGGGGGGERDSRGASRAGLQWGSAAATPPSALGLWRGLRPPARPPARSATPGRGYTAAAPGTGWPARQAAGSSEPPPPGRLRPAAHSPTSSGPPGADGGRGTSQRGCCADGSCCAARRDMPTLWVSGMQRTRNSAQERSLLPKCLPAHTFAIR